MLAGKRIAPRWVLRTLTCERVEDCQLECGREKRFVCEGFNYRLDPSGRGQGVCELIEVPLGQMDIFSSANRRDENLIFHPDYDYYERDRNACRPALCSNCGGGGPGGGGSSSSGSGERPYPPPPNHHEDYPATTYRPNIFVPSYADRNPPTAPEHSGYGSGARPPSRPHTTAVDSYIPTRYDSRPTDYDRYDIPPKRPSTWSPRPSSNVVDRFDHIRPVERPEYEITIYRDVYPAEDYRPSRRPASYDTPGPYRPPYEPTYDTHYEPRPSSKPDRLPGPIGSPYLERDRGRDRDRDNDRDRHSKPVKPYVPYTINQESSYSYGNSAPSTDYWGVKKEDRRPTDQGFNYFSLGGSRYNPNENSVLSYPGSKYDERDRNYYGNLWTRRPGKDGE